MWSSGDDIKITTTSARIKGWSHPEVSEVGGTVLVLYFIIENIEKIVGEEVQKRRNRSRKDYYLWNSYPDWHPEL